MTKKELLEALEHVPDDAQIKMSIRNYTEIMAGDAYNIIYDKMSNSILITNNHEPFEG